MQDGLIGDIGHVFEDNDIDEMLAGDFACGGCPFGANDVNDSRVVDSVIDLGFAIGSGVGRFAVWDTAIFISGLNLEACSLEAGQLGD